LVSKFCTIPSPYFCRVLLIPVLFFSAVDFVTPLHPDEKDKIRGFRKGEIFSVRGCKFQFPEASIVERGEGTGIFYRIYPRKGDDFFFTIRGFPSRVPENRKSSLLELEEEALIVNGNEIRIRKRYIPEGNLLLYQAVRKENSELLEFFLSCDGILE